MKTILLIKKTKTNRKGMTSIRCRITIDKSRKEFSTGLFIKPNYWDKDNQKVLDETENSKTVNSQLSLIKQKLNQAFLMLQIQGESFDVEDIYRLYFGENTKNEMGVIGVYFEHNTYYKKIEGKDFGIYELIIS